MIKLLINTRFGMDDDFRKPISKTKLWNKVADVLNKQKNYSVSGSICDAKWRNLLVTYRRNKDKARNKTGESAITWPYFQLFNDELGNRDNISPAAALLMGSLPSPESGSTDASSGSHLNSDSPSTTPTPPPDSKRKELLELARKRKAAEPPEWFQAYLERREREDKEHEAEEQKRWDRMFRIEEEKMEHMKALTAVLEKFVNK